MNLVPDSVPGTPCDVRPAFAATTNRDSGRAPIDPDCIARALEATRTGRPTSANLARRIASLTRR
jgi:hypothetical protein